MTCSLQTSLCVSGLSDNLRFSKSSFFPLFNIENPLLISHQNAVTISNAKPPNFPIVNAQASSICVSRAQRWWTKTLKPNMIEIRSAQALVDSLLDAGDKLAILDFYSPGCGGCKALHPKICQLAELNPDAIFLKVNFEELKTMCQALNVRVLPFFRFYRGGDGRLCSFSCTNATIKKFKDALAKHGSDRCSIDPTKGLDESEIERLALAGELSVSSPSPYLKEGTLKDLVVMKDMDPLGPWSVAAGNKRVFMAEENLILKD